jgi:hypothetical protein
VYAREEQVHGCRMGYIAEWLLWDSGPVWASGCGVEVGVGRVTDAAVGEHSP